MAPPSAEIAPDASTTGEAEHCSYATFGERLFGILVTSDRVAAAIAGLAGETFEIGPLPVGRGRLARVSVAGRIGTPSARRRGREPLRFRVTVPADIDLMIELTGQQNRFHGTVTVALDVTVRAALPLKVLFDVAPPAPADVEVALAADGLRASLLRTVADMDAEVAKQVARFIARELDAPHVREALEVDVAAQVAQALAARATRSRATRARG